MQTIFERIKRAFPDVTCHPPATTDQIRRVESALNTPFPEWLRELYLCSNGLEIGDVAALFPLDGQEESLASVLQWNEFIRAEWSANCGDEEHDPHDWLIVACKQGVAEYWEVSVRTGFQIFRHDWEGSPELVANDLVEIFLEATGESFEIRENLFRGREPYRNESFDDSAPAAKDIDRIIDQFREEKFSRKMRAQSPGLMPSGEYFQRGISAKSGDVGELVILSIGLDEDLRMISRDGNFPFQFRLKPYPFVKEYACEIANVSDAVQLMQGAERARDLVGMIPTPDPLQMMRH